MMPFLSVPLKGPNLLKYVAFFLDQCLVEGGKGGTMLIEWILHPSLVIEISVMVLGITCV